jgi:hypothetical protein
LRGWQFYIIDESRIRDRTLENIRFLQRYRRTYFRPEQAHVLVECISNLGRVSCHIVLDGCRGSLDMTEGIALIFHLLATRQLDCDIGEQLTDTSDVWIPVHDIEE